MIDVWGYIKETALAHPSCRIEIGGESVCVIYQRGAHETRAYVRLEEIEAARANPLLPILDRIAPTDEPVPRLSQRPVRFRKEGQK